MLIAPVEGKTYTLFGKSDTSSGYYHKIEHLADRVLDNDSDINHVLQVIQSYSLKKRLIQKISNNKEDKELVSYILHLLNDQLSGYTEKTGEHLETLPLVKKWWDKRLGTTRIQYHLYMLEIELTNRLNKNDFKRADKKIALLPHCLRDFNVECKAVPVNLDYQCRHCSKNCYQNHASRLLDDHMISPYIWMGGSIRKKARSLKMPHETLGILGIACVPELVAGMRKCRKFNIPAIGIPLNANRCIRWMGSFHDNSADLEKLENLII